MTVWPRCSESAEATSATPATEQLAQVDLAVKVTPEEITDEAQHQGDQESGEAPGSSSDAQQEAGKQAND